MKKTPKKAKPKKLHPEHDQYLMRIGKGERLYKFYYFRPMAGRRENFEYLGERFFCLSRPAVVL